MNRDCLSERLRALAEDPQDEPVRINVHLSEDRSTDERQSAIAKLQALSAAPVNYRSALRVATVVIPRNLLNELKTIEGIERADLDSTASHRELID